MINQAKLLIFSYKSWYW